MRKLTANRSRLMFGWAAILTVYCVLAPEYPGVAQPKKEEGKEAAKNVIKGKEAEDLVQLKREVDALETLYHLEPSETQLNGLLALAKQTAVKPKSVKEATASADYLKTLKNLHAALAKDDEEQIDALNAKLAEIQEADDVEIDDQFEITEAAMKAAPAALKLLRAAQVVSFLAALDDEVPDPVERVLLSLSEGEELTVEEWKNLRDETAEEIGWLVRGFDHEAANKLAKDVAAVLDRGHRFKGDALKKELLTLEQAVHKTIGPVSPTTVLQHFMERELAELLSNPRAVAAMKSRLDQVKKDQ